MIDESVSMLASIILKSINLTTSLLKNLSNIGILYLRMMRKTWRPLIINVSTQEAYWRKVLKLISWNLSRRNCMDIMEPFMLIIFWHLLHPFNDILLVLLIPMNLDLRSSYHVQMNNIIRLVINYVISLK